MMTVRQLERFWQARRYDRIILSCLYMRPEDSPRLQSRLVGPTAAAALAIIRLDELHQPQAPFYSLMLRSLLAAQEPDGGWGDPVVTALCIRALACCNGQGRSIDAAMGCLANLQKLEGAWPAEPIRRMPADPFVTAFILSQLSGDFRFRQAVRFDEAVEWINANRSRLDEQAQRLCRRIDLSGRVFHPADPLAARQRLSLLSRRNVANRDNLPPLRLGFPAAAIPS